MKDAQFRFDMKGVNLVDKRMKDTLASATYVLQDEIREAQVIPRMDGTLSGEAFTVHDYSRRKYMLMTFATPYARRLYYHPEYNFHKEPWVDKQGRSHDGNPNAQGKWMRHWIKGGKYENRLSEIFERLLKL